MYLVQRNNNIIAVVSDLESAMAVFNANKRANSWLQVIDMMSGAVSAYWIG